MMAEPEDPQSVAGTDPRIMDYVCAIWNLIIRPPRAGYSRVELMAGYPCGKFKLNRQPVIRSNFLLTNDRGLKLACTLFEPDLGQEGAARPCRDGERACVVYCHGNASCRLAAFRLVRVLLPLNIALACFDFAGCGMSGGKYISLGYFERDDLACVINHLRGERGFNRIGLWGISMGAATALMQAARDPSLAGVVADSPFADLWKLIEEICYNAARVPALVLSPVLNLVRWVIRRKAGFDIKDVSPIAHVSSSFVPALFLHGEDDDFVTPANSAKLANAYPGESQLLTMPGTDHNSWRSEKFVARATLFLVRALRWEQHLPAGVGEDVASAISRIQGQESRELPKISAEADREIKDLLASGERRDRHRGLVRAACELCVAYRGASLVAFNNAPSSASPDLQARCPARFTGCVTFADPYAEIAVVWTQAVSGAGENVYFAMLSPTAASLSEVVLCKGCGGVAAAGGGGPARGGAAAVPGGSSPGLTCAGRSCQAVRPLAFGAPLGGAALELGQPHRVVLTIAGAAVQLSVGDITISNATSCSGDLYLWCTKWEQKDGAVAPCLELKKDSGSLEETLHPPESPSRRSACRSGGGLHLPRKPRQSGKGPDAAAQLTEGLESLRSSMQETLFSTDESAVPGDMECDFPRDHASRVSLRSAIFEM